MKTYSIIDLVRIKSEEVQKAYLQDVEYDIDFLLDEPTSWYFWLVHENGTRIVRLNQWELFNISAIAHAAWLFDFYAFNTSTSESYLVNPSKGYFNKFTSISSLKDTMLNISGYSNKEYRRAMLNAR